MLDEILCMRRLTDSGTSVISTGWLHVPGTELSVWVYTCMIYMCALQTVVYVI